jgi:hypothetical protein
MGILLSPHFSVCIKQFVGMSSVTEIRVHLFSPNKQEGVYKQINIIQVCRVEEMSSSAGPGGIMWTPPSTCHKLVALRHQD